MTYQVQKTLPPATEVLTKLPITNEIGARVKQDRQEISDILTGKDSRKLLIVGPCSAWPSDAVIEYYEKLKPIAEKVADKIKIVGRVYIQKPRTTVGWTGPLNQPDPGAPADMESGIYYCREMMIRVLELGFALADEALFTHNDGYFVDLLSWVAIGARSTEDQEHRVFASMIPHPVGLKNPTSGNMQIAVNSIVSAQHPHVFALHRNQIETSGNPLAHLILRGGKGKSNFSEKKILRAVELMDKANIENPAVIVDASHENSINPETGKKDPLLQPRVISEVLDLTEKNSDIANAIKGFMVESFIEDGGQSFAPEGLKYGCSITDPCLGIEKTEKMIMEIAERL
ncbi:MAG: 3-deoxy-7-phosphoheptulonate synthase [Candidatus Peregrinibacteria bacterium]|nr:3-deoxy-7-phosphoheptulonate synthase [Candidatus Peregrinibacteria bacterium]